MAPPLEYQPEMNAWQLLEAPWRPQQYSERWYTRARARVPGPVSSVVPAGPGKHGPDPSHKHPCAFRAMPRGNSGEWIQL